MMEEERYAPWFCGSSISLTTVPFGIAITQSRALARAYSHKPSLVVADTERQVRHNGRLPGYLYQVVGPVTRAEITPVPGSVLPPGWEWWPQRPFRLQLIEETFIEDADLLTPQEEVALRFRNAGKSGK